MFDVIEGFQSKGVASVTLKHLKRFLLISLFFVVGILIGRLIRQNIPLTDFTPENSGMLIGMVLIAGVDYLREIAGLRKIEQSSEKNT